MNKKVMAIYSISNSVTGDCYIGSSRNSGSRWVQHKSSLECGRHHNARLQSDWIKYGKESFEFSLIEIINDENSLIEREKFYFGEAVKIGKSYSTRIPGYGPGRPPSAGEEMQKISLRSTESILGRIKKSGMSMSEFIRFAINLELEKMGM